jgi:endonuclease G
MATRKKTPSNLSKKMKTFFAGVLCGLCLYWTPHVKDLITDGEMNVEWIDPFSTQASAQLFTQPLTAIQINRSSYALAYDGRTRNPFWVYEYLTAENTSGDVDREQYSFKEDPLIPEHIRATNADYKGSNFDRGHLCRAGDAKSSELGMEETFFLSNASPQVPQFNRGYWKRLENYVSDLVKEYKSVRVITGPLYLPQQDKKGVRKVTYQVMGPSDVAVPTHFFKVIFAESANGKIKPMAYILPNEKIDSEIPLDHFKTTVEGVEKASGLLFYNQHNS